MRCITLFQTSRFYEFRLIIMTERAYDFRFGLRTARAFSLLYAARRKSRLRQTCPFSEIVSRCVCVRVRVGMTAPFALVNSVSSIRTGRIYNDVFITMPSASVSRPSFRKPLRADPNLLNLFSIFPYLTYIAD